MTTRSLKQYYLNLLGKKDYSQKELINKAKNMGFEESEIEMQLNWLRQKNYLNEERLAQNLILAYKLKGTKWLQQKMQQRLIEPAIIQATLDKGDFTDYTILRHKIATKYKIINWKKLDLTAKQKVMSFLYRQGFSNAAQIINRWAKGEE